MRNGIKFMQLHPSQGKFRPNDLSVVLSDRLNSLVEEKGKLQINFGLLDKLFLASPKSKLKC